MDIHRWRCAMAVTCVGVAILGMGVRADETVIDTTAESVLADSPTHSTCAIADRSGNIWIGSEDGDLRCYHPASKSWTHYTQLNGLGDNYVYALCCDRAGRIWAGHLNHGVSVFDGKS